MKTVSNLSPDSAEVLRAVDKLERLGVRFIPNPPATRPPISSLSPFNCPAINHPTDPDNRTDVLSRIRVVKTVQPGIRDVLLDGAKIGRIAACPWGPGWMASSTRSRLYWSLDDAALALIEGVSP